VIIIIIILIILIIMEITITVTVIIVIIMVVTIVVLFKALSLMNQVILQVLKSQPPIENLMMYMETTSITTQVFTCMVASEEHWT
jgi:hypothetical protein